MGVRPDSTIAGEDQAKLGDEGVFDAHLPDVEELNPVLAGEIAHQPHLLRGKDVLVRHKMVGDHNDFLRVEDSFDA